MEENGLLLYTLGSSRKIFPDLQISLLLHHIPVEFLHVKSLMSKKGKNRAGSIAQCRVPACLACGRPWVCSQHHHKERKERKKFLARFSFISTLAPF